MNISRRKLPALLAGGVAATVISPAAASKITPEPENLWYGQRLVWHINRLLGSNMQGDAVSDKFADICQNIPDGALAEFAKDRRPAIGTEVYVGDFLDSKRQRGLAHPKSIADGFKRYENLHEVKLSVPIKNVPEWDEDRQAWWHCSVTRVIAHV